MGKYRVSIVIPIDDLHEDVIEFTGDYGMPMEIHHAERWTKENGYTLIKSPAKITRLYPAGEVSTGKNHKVFYAVKNAHGKDVLFPIMYTRDITINKDRQSFLDYLRMIQLSQSWEE